MRSLRAFISSPLALLILLSAFAWAPLLAPGYFLRAHDARHSLIWLSELHQGVESGFLWPRWAPDHAQGYGYPLFTFYAPLAFLIAEVFNLLGAGILGAIKIVWVLATILAGVSMYQLGKRLWGVGPGFIAGLLYMVAPYHLVNIYVRGAFAEFVALAIYPWVVLTFWDALTRPSARRVALAALSLGALLLTHSVTIMLLPPLLALLILYWLALAWRREGRPPLRAAVAVLAAGALGGMLAAIFLLPVLGETSYIVVDQWLPAESYNYPQQFLYFFQWFDFQWGYGFALPGPNDGMNLSIGLWLILLGVAALPLVFRRMEAGKRAMLAGLLAMAAMALFATLAPSRVFWDVIPMIKLVQFPFRFLAPATLFLTLTAAGTLAALSPASRDDLHPLLLVLAAAILLSAWTYAKPQHTEVSQRDVSPAADIFFELDYPDMRGSTAFASAGKPATSPKIDAYVKGRSLPLAEIAAGEGEVEAVQHGGGEDVVRVRAQTPVTVRFYTYWYPGWRAWVDGEPAATFYDPNDPNALIQVRVPPGEHVVRIRFTNTPLRTAAALISALTLLILVILFFWDTIRSHAPQSLPQLRDPRQP